MSDSLESPTGLTANQEKAASLDAKGEMRSVIARACEVTPKTISTWRKSPTYVTVRDQMRQEITDELDARTKSVKAQLLEGVSEAISTLREALNAERDDGTPEYGTRARAAEALLGKAKFVYDGDGSGDGGQAATAAVIMVNMREDGKVDVIEGNAIDG